ncbi:hypothetical protein VNI00_000442 [Paramarasmius palmivorus]|uniref:Protein-S-isoprenylcysteine O-methyltransferase n=1 Tax=Paramarasmius palmivorus TaxID=297713 RepID=A0AAW0E5J7_9AGAR
MIKATLLLLSTVAFRVTVTPPNGPPTTIPPRPTFKNILTSEVREWVLRLVLFYFLSPLGGKLFYLASFNEIIYILNNDIGLNSLFLIGALLSITGGIIRYLCYQALAGTFTFEVVPAGARSQSPSTKPRLITHGLYSIVRHPSYTGWMMNFVGSVMVHLVDGTWIRMQSRPAIVALVGAWVIIMGFTSLLLWTRVDEEDEMMMEQFGEEWVTWQRRVRYKLVPGVY